jgi:hypothetical protein
MKEIHSLSFQIAFEDKGSANFLPYTSWCTWQTYCFVFISGEACLSAAHSHPYRHQSCLRQKAGRSPYTSSRPPRWPWTRVTLPIWCASASILKFCRCHAHAHAHAFSLSQLTPDTVAPTMPHVSSSAHTAPSSALLHMYFSG